MRAVGLPPSKEEEEGRQSSEMAEGEGRRREEGTEEERRGRADGQRTIARTRRGEGEHAEEHDGE